MIKVARQLLVFSEGKKEFRITIPDDSKVTFGPWSPGSSKSDTYNSVRALTGTLRIYRGKTDTSGVIGVFSGVSGYRDLSLIDYEEKTNIETGSIVWKSDKKGYFEEKKINRDESWDNPQLTAGLIDANAAVFTEEEETLTVDGEEF